MPNTLTALASPTNAGTETARPQMLSGCAVVPARDCWYPPAVEVADLLRVDFDRRDIGPNGLYLVESLNEQGGVAWRGCRSFRKMPITGELRLDHSGEGDWMDISSLCAFHLRIVGYVEQVYKPVTR